MPCKKKFRFNFRIVQVMENGHGFLLQQKKITASKSQSVFLPAPLVRTGLKTGHQVHGLIRAKMEQSTCPVMLRVDQVMGVSPEEATRVTPFTELTPYYPLERMYLETHQEVEWDNVAMRVVDLVSPVGFGQRGLIVAPTHRKNNSSTGYCLHWRIILCISDCFAGRRAA